MQTLDRDLPETVYCFICKRLRALHQRHETGPRAEQIYNRVWQGRCRWYRDYYGTFDTSHSLFQFDHIQMAMKLYRRGLVSDAKRDIGCYFFEPRVVKDQISICPQSWIVIPEEQGSVLSRIHLRQVCPHLERMSLTHENPYLMGLVCNRKHLAAKEDSCEKCCTLIRCRYSPTEVFITKKKCLNNDAGDGVLIMTKWQELGQRLSSLEGQWRKNFECPACSCTPWPYHPDDTLGSIRAGFEDQPGTKYNALLKNG